MGILDLNHLNLVSPYTLWETGENEYTFRTNHGVLYRICFDGNQSIWDEGAYEFGIYNDNSYRFVLKVSSIIAEGVVNYIALIATKDNPNIERILSDFNEFIGFFNHKPE